LTGPVWLCQHPAMIVAHSLSSSANSSTAQPRYQVLALPAFVDNYLWLLHDGCGAAVVIDPGDAAVVRRALHAHQLTLKAILLTHHHADHIGGVTQLAHAGIAVYGPHDPRVPATTRVAEGERIEPDWGGGSFGVLEVPGHTRSHLAYRIADDLFCGDALFILGCGRLFEGTPRQAWDSLQKLAALPDTVQIYCAHEYTAANLRFAQSLFPDDPQLHDFALEVQAKRAKGLSTVPGAMGRERQLNPYLRMAQPFWRAQLGQPELHDDDYAAFAEVRRRKDDFS
jgi:hydroxyacylglutathione hydrolase